jgi:hypothetical protein
MKIIFGYNNLKILKEKLVFHAYYYFKKAIHPVMCEG